MYTIVIFEQAMNSCGYTLDQVIYMPRSLHIRRVIGRIRTFKRISINGVRKDVIRQVQCRWDAVGRCFSHKANRRLSQYDLPLRTIIEFNKHQDAITLLD